MPGRIKVLIVDDHPLFRQGLRQMVENDPRFELVGEAGDGKSALQLILEKKPDIAVLDVNLPGLSGLEIGRASCRERVLCSVGVAVLKDKNVVPDRVTLVHATLDVAGRYII